MIRPLKSGIMSHDENVIMFIGSKTDEHIVFMLNDLIKNITKTSNIICFTTKTNYSPSLLDTISNCCVYHVSKPDDLYKQDMADWLRDNKTDIIGYINKFFISSFDEITNTIKGKIRSIVVLPSGDFVLPYTRYFSNEHEMSKRLNTFHDSIEETDLCHLNDINVKLQTILYHYRPNTFVYASSNVIISLLYYFIMFKGVKKVDAFYVDPSLCLDHITVNSDAELTKHYIVDDHRGTRNFQMFPLGVLLYNELQKENYFLLEKSTKNLVFGGRFGITKGKRAEIFFDLIADLKFEDSVIYTPLGMSFKNHEKSYITDENEKLTEAISNHPLVQNPIPYFNLMAALYEHKYTVVIPPWTFHDSHNLRLYEAIALDVLPFIHVLYDIDRIQIPENIFNLLVVRTHDDLAAKMCYYNNNEIERQSLIQVLKELLIDNVDVESYIKRL